MKKIYKAYVESANTNDYEWEVIKRIPIDWNLWRTDEERYFSSIEGVTKWFEEVASELNKLPESIPYDLTNTDIRVEYELEGYYYYLGYEEIEVFE